MVKQLDIYPLTIRSIECGPSCVFKIPFRCRARQARDRGTSAAHRLPRVARRRAADAARCCRRRRRDGRHRPQSAHFRVFSLSQVRPPLLRGRETVSRRTPRRSTRLASHAPARGKSPRLYHPVVSLFSTQGEDERGSLASLASLASSERGSEDASALEELRQHNELLKAQLAKVSLLPTGVYFGSFLSDWGELNSGERKVWSSTRWCLQTRFFETFHRRAWRRSTKWSRSRRPSSGCARPRGACSRARTWSAWRTSERAAKLPSRIIRLSVTKGCARVLSLSLSLSLERDVARTPGASWLGGTSTSACTRLICSNSKRRRTNGTRRTSSPTKRPGPDTRPATHRVPLRARA